MIGSTPYAGETNLNYDGAAESSHPTPSSTLRTAIPGSGPTLEGPFCGGRPPGTGAGALCKGHPQAKELVDMTLSTLKLEGPCTLLHPGPHRRRTLETKIVVDAMQAGMTSLSPTSRAAIPGPSTRRSGILHLAAGGQGRGLHEAPEGRSATGS